MYIHNTFFKLNTVLPTTGFKIFLKMEHQIQNENWSLERLPKAKARGSCALRSATDDKPTT